MQITRTRSKYYLLSLFGALLVALGVLAMAPSSAQAQDQLAIDKECTPNPVQIGQQLTCTVDVGDISGGPPEGNVIHFEDTFPAGITPTGATATGAPPAQCQVDGNTVRCRAFVLSGSPARFTITATAEQCGTFQNTAIAGGFSPPGEPRTGEVTDTEEITVVGCEEPPESPAPGQQPGAPAPITQETEQEAESGDIDQSFEITSEGENSNQCAGVQGAANTGNSQNVIDLLQALSETDDFEFEEVGSDITVSPESSTTCEQQVNQAASASG